MTNVYARNIRLSVKENLIEINRILFSIALKRHLVFKRYNDINNESDLVTA